MEAQAKVYVYGQGTGTTPTQKQASQMELHASQLQSHADALNAQIVRLSSLIDRLTGPVPDTASVNSKEPPPAGVLVVAQFESRRIAEGLDRLTDQLNRLEQIA